MLTVEYDGTNYAGWQRQDNAMTIQQHIEENLKKVTGEEITLHGSGRTDSGVHAMGQVAHFDTEARMPAEKFAYALNVGLPEDIRIKESKEVDESFHCRFGAKKKHYRYVINNGDHASALFGKYQLHVHKKLDTDAMAKAAKCIVGEHDFSAFKAVECTLENTVRTIYRSEITRDGDVISYDIVGSGFMYNMVRIIVGTLIEIGKGKYPAEYMAQVLASCDRANAGPTAPAKGLTMVEVTYV